MGHRWTSGTLPRVPSSTTTEEQESKRDLFVARHQALEDLLNAEQAEAAARSMRTIANQSVEHYKALLEAQVTEPLFEVGET